MLIFLRSILCNIILYTGTAVGLTILSPLLLGPKKLYMWIPKAWSTWVSWVLKKIVGIRYIIKGTPPTQPVLFAIKHQSAWETVALNHILKAPVYILKKELLYIFPFGLYLKKAGMIPLDRKGGVDSLKRMLSLSKKRIEEGHSVIIFPEGTRSQPGKTIPYKKGIYTLYRSVNVPVVPVALNSGLYWPRRHFLKYPGTITISFLPTIQVGLKQEEFMSKLQTVIESESLKLLK